MLLTMYGKCRMSVCLFVTLARHPTRNERDMPPSKQQKLVLECVNFGGLCWYLHSISDNQNRIIILMAYVTTMFTNQMKA